MRRAGELTPAARAAGRNRTVAGAGLLLAAAVIGAAAMMGGSAEGQGWVAREPVPEGARVGGQEFEPAAVSVPEMSALWPSGSTPTGYTARSLRPGDPLLAGDLHPAVDADSRRVTLAVAPERLPDGLAPGDTVDVWAPGATEPLLQAVPVQAVAPPDLGDGRVEVAVPGSAVPDAVAAATAEQLVLVRHP